MNRLTHRKRSERVHVRQQRRTRRARRLLLESLEDRRLLAFDAQLVADINAVQTDYASSEPADMLQIGSVLYFTAETPAAGRELWRSDGTAAGTVMVKDINPGAGDAFYDWSLYPNLTNVNGTLFFTANDGTNGFELWKSDGTEAGTKLVKIINLSDGGLGEPALLTAVNSLLFFRAGAANDGIYGPELWVSDGTEAGTQMVKDIDTTGQFNGSRIRDLTNVNGTLFFTAVDAIDVSSRDVWKSDGTEHGTKMVMDTSFSAALTNVNGTLFFRTSSSSGNDLWKSDGINTNLVKNLNDYQYGLEPMHLTAVNNTLFFFNYQNSTGWELWKSDGTEANTVMVKDINPATGTSANSSANYLTNVNGTLFFSANDGTHGYELWKSDGTEAGTEMVKDIQANSGSSFPGNLTNVNGTLFFAANDGTQGEELWKSDGTPANTVLVKDIRAGANSGYPFNLANVNDTLFFAANDGSCGYELWKSDGTGANTVLVKDINVRTFESYPYSLANVNGTLFLCANDGANGYELWKSDGTVANTVLLKDINTGPGASYPHYLTNVSGTLFFSANDGTNGYQLWKSDGTPGGTVQVKNLSAGDWDSLAELTNVNGTLFFRADDDVNGYELWKSDGTPDGTVLVKDINGSGSSYPKHLTNVNGTLFFRANGGASGSELWKSDGTAANTVLVKDINPGSGDSLSRWGNPLTNMNGTLFFSANDGTHGYELWKSDGTAENTVLVKDVYAEADGSYPDYLTNVNGTLFFSANDGRSGYDLWKSDGTAENTVLVKDIRPGSLWTNSGPQHVTAVSGTLFFTANDGAYGRELWKSDGTEANTVVVKDICLGTPGSYPEYLTNVNGTLFFSAEDGLHGSELWTSDGSESGTALVKDIRSGADDSEPYQLTAVNGTLFFTADDGVHGTELWQAFPLASTPSLLAELAGGNLVISDAAPAGAANQLTVRFSGGNVLITDANEQFTGVPATTPPSTLSPDGRTLTVPLAAFSGSVIVNGAGGTDTLTVDFLGGGSLPRGVAFDGGEPASGPGDKLIVTHAVYGTLTLNHTSGSAGSVDVDGSVITYTGLEPVDIADSSGSNLVINLPDTSNTTSFGISGGNLIVDNTDGPPQTHEDDSIDLTGITSIEINAGGGNDTLTFLASFGGYTGSLNVDGEGGTDSLTFNSTLSLAAGSDFTATAETISVNSAIATAGAGTILLQGTGSASLVSVNQILTTAGGSVTVRSDNDISFGAAGGISSTGGSVTVSAYNSGGGGSGGAVTMTDGAVIDAGSGPIDLSAYEDITLSLLRSTGLIYVWNYGAILDADTAGLDVDGGQVVFWPDLNVGTAANPIETRVSHLEAEAFVGGDIYVTNDGALTIGGIGELGTLRSNGGDIGISATGDLTLRQTVDAGSGDVVLSSGGAIVDDNHGGEPPHVYALVDIIGQNAVLEAVTGIGSLDALETEIVTLDAYNDGEGNIGIDEMAAGGDLDVQQATVRGETGSIWLTVARGNLTVLAGGDGVSLANERNDTGSIWLDANVTVAGTDEPLRGNVIVNADVLSGYSVTITADHDVTGSTDGDIRGSAGVTITADDNDGGPSGGDNGTIQLAGAITATDGTVTFSLADCDGWIGDSPGSFDGNVEAQDIVMGVDAAEGVLRLQGDYSYFSGTTTVVQGTLLVNGYLVDTWSGNPQGGEGDVVVEAGGVLGGHGDGTDTGVIAASITVLDGGVLEPGDYLHCTPQTGRLTVDMIEGGGVDIRPGGTFRVQLGGPNFGAPVDGHDQLLLRGTANLNGALDDGSGGGSLNVQLVDGYSVPAGAEYWLIDNDDDEQIDTCFLDLPEGAVLTAGGASLKISYRGGSPANDVVLTRASGGPPTATFGNNGPVNEGSTATVTFSNPADPDSNPPFHYAYDFDNDGTFEVGDGTFGGSSANASETVPASFLADGPGTRTVRGRIIDSANGFTDYTTTITINNVVPTAVFIGGAVVYENSFEGGADTAWSSPITDVTPVGNRRFLGQFGSQTVSLNLDGLPGHDQLTLSFDLFAIRSWGGNALNYGVDVFDIRVSGGPTLLHTTFSNYPQLPEFARQAYPGSYPGGDHLAMTGAAETNSLGYFSEGWAADSVYFLSYSFPHSGSSVQVDFSFLAPTQGLADESWGLDNVLVTVASVQSVTFSHQFDPSPADTQAGLHYAYDLDGDGAFDDGAGDGSYAGSLTTPSYALPFSTPGPHLVHGRILDDDGGSSDYWTTVTIPGAPEIDVQLGGVSLPDDTGSVAFGTTIQGTPVDRVLTISNTGTDPLNLSSLTLPAGFALVGSFPATVPAGGNANFTVRLTATAAGTYEGRLSFQNNDADENPYVLTLSGQVLAPASKWILDDGDAGFTAGGFTLYSSSKGYLGDVRFALPGTGSKVAQWQFNLASLGMIDGLYRVSTLWYVESSRTTNATYKLYDGTSGGTLRGTAVVNQQVAPRADVVDASRNWQDLGYLTTTGGVLTVTLSDAVSGGAAVADAIRIERLDNREIEVSLDGTTSILADGSGAVNFGSVFMGSTAQVTLRVKNIGVGTLTLTNPPAVAGQFTLVSGFGSTLLAANDGAPGGADETTFVIGMDTSAAGSKSGTLSFDNDDADENPFDLTLTGAVSSVKIIDDGEAGYAENAAWSPYSGGYQGDLRFSAANAGKTATWTFAGLPSGTYRISATWVQHTNRANNAPYQINGGGAIPRNQKLAPSDPSFTRVQDPVSGKWFADLAVGYGLSGGGTLTVTLTDVGANGYVIADAIRVERTGALFADGEAAGALGSVVAGAPLTEADVQPLLAAAAAYWSATDPAAAARLANVELVVTPLTGQLLGLASAVTQTVWIDQDGAGLGWSLNREPRTLNPAYDLLSVLEHELGHVLGYDHDDVVHEVMAATLSPLSAGATAHRSLLTDYRSPITGHSSLVTGHWSPVTGSASVPDAWFGELGREDRADGLWTGRAEAGGEVQGALAASPEPSTRPLRVQRPSRLQRYEQDADAWFAELAAELEGGRG